MAPDEDPAGDPGPAGEELIRSYFDGDRDDEQALLAIYARHREAVRSELEAAGLGPAEAEFRLGAVFLRLSERKAGYDPDTPFGDLLRDLAREVAMESSAAGAGPDAPRPASSPFRLPEGPPGVRGGFYGSGY